jgi:hypothetical protein
MQEKSGRQIETRHKSTNEARRMEAPAAAAAAAAPALPFKWADRLAGNVHGLSTDALSAAASGGADCEQPLFVHCQTCDPERSGLPSLQLAALAVRCAVCHTATGAAAEEPEPEPDQGPEPPETLHGVYKSSDDVERLQHKIKNRRADAANFAAFGLAGDDLAAAVAGVDTEIEQLSARVTSLERASAGIPPEAEAPPSGFTLAPLPSTTFASLVDGSMSGTCYSASCGGARTAAEVLFRCDNCNGLDCTWLPQIRRPLAEEECCISLMEIDEPPTEGGACPPCAVVFDPCGCVADVTMFVEQVKQGIESGGGRSVITMDPATELWSMRCPNHPQGGEHETSFVHCVHHFKLAGPKLYGRIKDWGMEQMVLEAGGICCPIGGCPAQGSPFMRPAQPIDAAHPTKHRCEACSSCAVMGGQCPGCEGCRYFCSECHVEWGSSRDCAHSYVAPPEPEPAGPTDHELLMQAMEEFGFAQCPKCKEGAELKQGCKYVYCRCKQHFCYHCSRPLAENQHFSHFTVSEVDGIEVGEKDGPYGNKCVGGRTDGKGHVAEPACPECRGWSNQKTDCEACRDWLRGAE